MSFMVDIGLGKSIAQAHQMTRTKKEQNDCLLLQFMSFLNLCSFRFYILSLCFITKCVSSQFVSHHNFCFITIYGSEKCVITIFASSLLVFHHSLCLITDWVLTKLYICILSNQISIFTQSKERPSEQHTSRLLEVLGQLKKLCKPKYLK